MPKFIFLFYFLILILASSCGNENTAAQQKMLIGQWKFTNGTLNGNAEFAAQNYSLYTFNFSADGKVSSQILIDLGNTETMPYKIEADKIIIENSNNSFLIKKLTEKELALFFLLKVEKEDYEVEMNFGKQ